MGSCRGRQDRGLPSESLHGPCQERDEELNNFYRFGWVSGPPLLDSLPTLIIVWNLQRSGGRRDTSSTSETNPCAIFRIRFRCEIILFSILSTSDPLVLAENDIRDEETTRNAIGRPSPADDGYKIVAGTRYTLAFPGFPVLTSSILPKEPDKFLQRAKAFALLRQRALESGWISIKDSDDTK